MRSVCISAAGTEDASLIVRSYDDGDLGSIQRLLDALPSPTGQKYDAQDMVREHREDDVHVAELAGKAVAFAIGVFNDWNRTAYLDFILVGTDCLCQGIGTALLEAVVRSVEGKGARLMYTETAKANTAGLCFYVQNGFVPTGVIPNYY